MKEKLRKLCTLLMHGQASFFSTTDERKSHFAQERKKN